jgi:site-specific DNA recombinase
LSYPLNSRTLGGMFTITPDGPAAEHFPSVSPDLADEWADVAYTRISDDRTGVAASPARQRREIKAGAAEEGHAIRHWFEDLSKSAYKPGVVRPEFDALLAACQRYPVRRLWVLHGDRLIRDGDDLDLPRLIRALAPRKIKIRCIEAADLELWRAEGKMSARVRNAVNVYESERKRERVELAAQDRARKGRFSGGGRRFGYKQSETRVARNMDEAGNVHEEARPSGPLVLMPEEADAIASGCAAIVGGLSLYSVWRDWQERGLVGARGAELTPSAVREILLRPANAGLSVYRGEILGAGDWPRIIDPDTFAAVRAILTAPDRRTNDRPGRPALYLLSGILICGACGGPMVTGGADGEGKVAKYRCKRLVPAPEGQRHAQRSRPPLDAAITELVVARIKRRGTLPRPPRHPSGEVAAALAEEASLRGQVEGYLARGREFDPGQLAAILRDLNARLDEARSRIRAEAGTPVSDALGASTDIYAAWNALDLAGRRAAILEQVEGFTVGAGFPGNRYPLSNVAPIWRDAA